MASITTTVDFGKSCQKVVCDANGRGWVVITPNSQEYYCYNNHYFSEPPTTSSTSTSNDDGYTGYVSFYRPGISYEDIFSDPEEKKYYEEKMKEKELSFDDIVAGRKPE